MFTMSPSINSTKHVWCKFKTVNYNSDYSHNANKSVASSLWLFMKWEFCRLHFLSRIYSIRTVKYILYSKLYSKLHSTTFPGDGSAAGGGSRRAEFLPGPDDTNGWSVVQWRKCATQHRLAFSPRCAGAITSPCIDCVHSTKLIWFSSRSHHQSGAFLPGAETHAPVCPQAPIFTRWYRAASRLHHHLRVEHVGAI